MTSLDLTPLGAEDEEGQLLQALRAIGHARSTFFPTS